MTETLRTDATSLTITEHIAASREIVFRYFTDPTRYARWMGTSAELDPGPGGTYRITVTDEIIARGEFVEVVAPERIVFTFGWEHEHGVGPGGSTVEVTLAEVDGGTTVTLRHTGLPTTEAVSQHAQGWTLYLGRLATVATGGEVGPDPNTL